MIRVIPLKFYDNGFMTQAFAFGGSRDKEKCEDVKYGSSLQNFLIDDGNEVILSDTGFPNDSPDMGKNPNMPLSMGEKVATFEEAFLKTGYGPAQVVGESHEHPHRRKAERRSDQAKRSLRTIGQDSVHPMIAQLSRVQVNRGFWIRAPSSTNKTPGVLSRANWLPHWRCPAPRRAL